MFIYKHAGVPESPRWLISKDRNEEALAVLAKFHANGNEQNSTVQFEYREIRETLELEREARENSSYLDFMKTKGNRWRLAIIVSVGLISQYSGNAVISNYMNLIYNGAGITDQNQKLGVSNTVLFSASLLSSTDVVLSNCRFRPARPCSICPAPSLLPSWSTELGVARCS